ncbi:MAG TPA: type II toxin-antitoxin system RatA family toxin [Aestuariivirga sp.]
MAKVALMKTVALSADKAFAIVADVSAYKEFVPLVKRSTIRGAVTEIDDTKSFAADLMVAYNRLSLSVIFTSMVEVNATARTVIATSDDGPIKGLKAVWQITPIDSTHSTVAIDIDYELKSKLMQMAVGGLMHRAVEKVLEAFEARGRQLYPMSALPNI